MLKKVVSYGVVGLLAAVLVGGSAYIFLRPEDAQAQSGGQGWRDQEQASQLESGKGIDPSYQGQGQGRGAGGGGLQSPSRGQGQGRGQGLGQGSEQNLAEGAATGVADWETLQGIVTVVDDEITVQTDAGDLVVGLGQAAYREASSFELAVGDEVLINGFDEDGEFKAGFVENLTTGQTITLRDESGRPMWAGRRRNQNQSARTPGVGASADAPAETNENTTDALSLDCPICETDLGGYDGDLTQQEVKGLLLALNDEYHAWAVYDQVIQDFGQTRPFVPIQTAESKHIDSLQPLFERYGLSIPENPWAGNVASFESVSAACAAGVDAEIANADLYMKLFSGTEREDVLRVYETLQWASLDKHLPALQRCAG